MSQLSLFAPDPDAVPEKPLGDHVERMTLLVVVKAAPNPSQTYGETVCVAALRIDPGTSGWIRLYPINFRALEDPQAFRKYEIITVEAKPATQDSRPESWRPNIGSLTRGRYLSTWEKRVPWISDYIEDSMCHLLQEVRENPAARSLAAIRPAEVDDLIIERHPGWTPEETAKIEAYVRQLDLFDQGPRRPLEAPRFKAWYRYRCHAPACPGHRQGLLDWEFVAHQRNMGNRDDAEICAELRKRWLEHMCGADRDTAFYVGNQAKRRHVFSVLGVFYPSRA
ncbi:hypothetical protein GCM10010106_17830 [Thermopolyspora flexuosa]|nr:hypothetical protein GCM10010106_17830 [Thermopolyspora flexuosa]